jgi:effector-binding domain-containing protein
MSQDVITTYDVTTRRLDAQHVAAVRRHTSMATIGEDVARGFAQIVGAIESVGARPAGPPFMVFHGRIDDEIGGEIELCHPVATPFISIDEVYGTKIPGTQVASTIHRGSYDEVGPAYAAILTWMDENGREPAGPPREYYLNDPEITKIDDLLTEITFPIA